MPLPPPRRCLLSVCGNTVKIGNLNSSKRASTFSAFIFDYIAAECPWRRRFSFFVYSVRFYSFPPCRSFESIYSRKFPVYVSGDTYVRVYSREISFLRVSKFHKFFFSLFFKQITLLRGVSIVRVTYCTRELTSGILIFFLR